MSCFNMINNTESISSCFHSKYLICYISYTYRFLMHTGHLVFAQWPHKFDRSKWCKE